MNIQTSSRMYWLKDPIWYAPLAVIFHYGSHLDLLPESDKGSKAFRKADELLVAATALLGIQIDEGKEYWIQPVSDTESSPDVRTGCFLPVDGRAPDFTTQDIEVVSFLPAPGEDIISFLGRTKLSKEKAYDEKTMVLCHMRTGTHIPSWLAVTTALQSTGAVCPVVVLGRIHPERKDYILVQVYPRLKKIVEYNVDKTLKGQHKRSVLNLHRGSKDLNTSRPNEEHCPFESMGFRCPLLKHT